MLLPTTVGYFITDDSFTYLYCGLQFGAIKLIPDTALACTSKAWANSFRRQYTQQWLMYHPSGLYHQHHPTLYQAWPADMDSIVHWSMQYLIWMHILTHEMKNYTYIPYPCCCCLIFVPENENGITMMYGKYVSTAQPSSFIIYSLHKLLCLIYK